MATAANIVTLSKGKQIRLVDELGALKAQIAALEDAYAQKISVFKDFGDGEYVGNVYKVVVNTAERAALDAKIVKGLLTPAQIVEATKVNVVTSAIVRAR